MTEESATTLTHRIAARAAQARWSDLPQDVKQLARLALLDWVGVTLGGMGEPLVRILRGECETCIAQPASGAHVLGTSSLIPLHAAALVNGAAGHALDHDDVHPLVGHPSVPILAALFAVGEPAGVSGDELLCAYVAGYEASCALGAALGPRHYAAGYHSTSTIGTIGAAVACARLLRLDATATRIAIGLAATQAAGLKLHFGTMAKPFHAGCAAHDGLRAARLAACGFSAGLDALDGPTGFVEMYGGGVGKGAALQAALTAFNLRANLFKLHAACYLTHAAIESALALRRDSRFAVDAVESVRVFASPSIESVCNIAFPRTGLELKFSIASMVAMVLDGQSTTAAASFSDGQAARLAELPLRQCTSVALEPGRTPWRTRVEVTLRGGDVLAAEHDSSEPEADLEALRGKLLAKFRATTGVPIHPERLVRALLEMDQVPDIRAVVDLMKDTSMTPLEESPT